MEIIRWLGTTAFAFTIAVFTFLAFSFGGKVNSEGIDFVNLVDNNISQEDTGSGTAIPCEYRTNFLTGHISIEHTNLTITNDENISHSAPQPINPSENKALTVQTRSFSWNIPDFMHIKVLWYIFVIIPNIILFFFVIRLLVKDIRYSSSY